MERRRRIAATLSAALITTALPFSVGASEYVVVSGDNLSKIAQNFNTTVAAITAANSIANPNYIYINQVLNIPSDTVTTTPETPLAANEYVVQRNDNLSKIADQFACSVADLVSLNQISNPNLIREGAILKVPTSVVTPEVAPEVEEVAPEVEEVVPEVEEVAPEVEEEVAPEVEEEVAPEVEEEVVPEVEEETAPEISSVKASDILPFATDMTTWKVQLPLWRDDTQLSVLEIDAVDLEAGYESEMFYVNEDGWVVLDCPVDGAKTANTAYSRNEFREMLDPSSTAVNWEFTGTHILNTTTKVTKAPSNGRTVTSQIHGIEEDGTNGPTLVKVEYDYTQKAVVVMLATGSDMTAANAYHYFRGVDLDQVFDTEIRVTGGSVYVTVESEERSETFYTDFAISDPNWYNYRGYFKAGNYVQDSTLDYEGEGATVLLNKMDVFHDNDYTEYVPATGFTLVQTELTMAANETTQLSGEFAPVFTLNKGIDWSVVEGSDFVAVDKKGNVTGLAFGSAVIRATSQDNPSIYADCAITVADIPPIENVVVFESDMTGLTVAERGEEGVYIAASGSSSASVVNEAGNDVIMVLDEDENANGRAEFYFEPQETTTTISFRIRMDSNTDKNANKPQTSCVYIDFGGNDGAQLSSSTQAFRLRNLAEYNAGLIFDNRWGISHSYSDVSRNLAAAEFELGQWKDISVIITPNNGTADANTATVYMDGMKVADRMTANTTVDFINQMNVYTGTADLIGFSIDDVVVYSGIKIPEAGAATAPSSVILDTLPTTMAVYDSVQLHAEVAPDGSEEAITYSISSGTALAVNANGFLTAKEVGTATVRAASTNYPDVYAEVEITVEAEITRVESVEAPVQLKMNRGEVEALTFNVLPDSASEKAVRYDIISGTEYFSVTPEGNVVALENGSGVIRITSLDNERAYADVAVNVVTVADPGTVIYEDTFSGTTLDTNAWETATSNVGNTINEIRDGALYFYDNNAGGQPKSWVTFEPQTETFTISYDFMLHRDYEAEKVSAANMGFGSGNIASRVNEAFRIQSYASTSNGEVTSRYFRYDIDGSSYQEIDKNQEMFTLELDKWVNISMTTTPDNGTEFANTTSIYLDGVLILENVANNTTMNTIDQFMFQTGSSDLTSFSIDNFKVWVGSYTDAQ